MTPSNHPPNPPNTVGGEPLDAEGRAVQEMLGASRYRIRNVLGRGGMSTVWLADDLSAGGRPVAVKVLNRELGDDDEFRQRFRNEASAARSVDSPNVVAIYSHDEPGRGADGPCYIVMEYIRGESLADVLRRRRTLPEHLALDVVEQTAHGLSAIHAGDLIHRDIKPGNLLVTPEGTVKITDFGIAKAAEAVPADPHGAWSWAPPSTSLEQAQRSRSPRRRTSIRWAASPGWSRVAAFVPGDTTVAVAVAHINEPPPALPQTVHPHIRELIGIMLRKDPGRRYADGRELAKAVRSVRQGNRPPQPAGVQPSIHRQSDAAHPATSELGALTEPGLRRPPETGLMGAGSAGAAGMAGAAGAAGGRASSPAPRTSAAPRTQQHAPRRKKSNAGLWLTLILLLAVLAGAVVVLMGQMSDQAPGARRRVPRPRRRSPSRRSGPDRPARPTKLPGRPSRPRSRPRPRPRRRTLRKSRPCRVSRISPASAGRRQSDPGAGTDPVPAARAAEAIRRSTAHPPCRAFRFRPDWRDDGRATMIFHQNENQVQHLTEGSLR